MRRLPLGNLIRSVHLETPSFLLPRPEEVKGVEIAERKEHSAER
jgi:hypothetical protein